MSLNLKRLNELDWGLEDGFNDKIFANNSYFLIELYS